ncbi:SANT/Myb_domain [Hexamita inflata]|uniref:SANT/Myb domain n=1 Tax=Hexamita inflata TaxID=28002 RepID=A0AA86RLU8_9EUKA|nr:SANT/Myb domain [Hexamita inflata]CAI9974419.1 SANT/Myb domain [Hexamita inflata]
MSKQKESNYNPWSSTELQYIVNATREYRDKKINWKQIQQQLKHRTIQQCKSFYNNHVKQYEFSYIRENFNDAQIAHMMLSYLAIGKLEDIIDPNNSKFETRYQKSWLQADFLIIIYQLQTNNKQFPYDAKLLNLLKEMIVFYNQIKPQIEKQLVQYGFGILGRHKINANQMNSLVSFMQSIDSDNLLEKINNALTDTQKTYESLIILK